MGTSTSPILQVTTPDLGVAPGPATNLTISSVTPTGLTLSWTAPSTGSGPFDYQVQQQLVGASTWTNVNGLITTTTLQIFGLQSNTAYNFQVLSLNTSSTTPSSGVSVTTSGLAPSTPTALALSGNPGPTSVTLQWTAPTSGTLPFTYQVYGSLHGANTFTAMGTAVSATTEQITGLVQGAAYDFYVVASNSAGSGAASSILSNVATASGATAPSAPLNLALVSADNNDLTVSWSPPASGTPPFTYVVQYRPTP
jgi:Fibronectin type III domain